MSGGTELDVEIGDGVVLHAYRRGSGRRGSGPTVVLAHGVLDDGACWTRVADALEADHDVIAYDARYHGLTREPAGAAWGGADDLVALVDALGIEQPVAMGHSMGAVTVAGAIATHPDRFRAAVLEDPAWRAGPLDPAAVEAGRAALTGMLSGTESEIEALGRQFSPGWDDAEYGPWARSKTRFRGAETMADALQQILATPWQDLVARVTIPVLLVCGGDEAKGRIVTAETALEAAALCPSLEVTMLPEAGHNIRRDAYDGYVAAVRAFLARTCE